MIYVEDETPVVMSAFDKGVHLACWPTSWRHVRLSAVCLVEATNDNDLKVCVCVSDLQ